MTQMLRLQLSDEFRQTRSVINVYGGPGATPKRSLSVFSVCEGARSNKMAGTEIRPIVRRRTSVENRASRLQIERVGRPLLLRQRDDLVKVLAPGRSDRRARSCLCMVCRH